MSSTSHPAPRGTPQRDALARIASEVTDCARCPRLVTWRGDIAAAPRAAFRDEVYWGRGVPGFGDPSSRMAIVGLAPAAHGANRTGRMFTGDRSGDFLFASLHRAGFASQPSSTRRGDGLELDGAYITAAVHCAPPDNKPTPQERDACLPFLERELAALANLRVIVVLGAFALDALARGVGRDGQLHGDHGRPKFTHGAELRLSLNGADRDLAVICSYHPSQRNVFTGLLTADAFDVIFRRARELAE